MNVPKNYQQKLTKRTKQNGSQLNAECGTRSAESFRQYSELHTPHSELKLLHERLWHFTSVGLGNCRAAQRVRREIEQHESRSGTGVSPLRFLNRSDAQSQRNALANQTIEQLTAGLSYLESVGLANSRAAEINRRELCRRLLIQSALLANANFNPNEPRDQRGRWTQGGDAASSATNKPDQPITNLAIGAPASRPGAMSTNNPNQYLRNVSDSFASKVNTATNSPAQTNAATRPNDSLPDNGKPDAVESSTMEGIGGLLDLAGKGVWNLFSADAFEAIGDDEDAFKQLGFSSDQLKKWGFKDVEEDSGTTGEKPIEQGIQSLPPAERGLSRAGEGVVESTPRLGIAAANPYLGALAFGATPEGFDFKQAALAAALPLVGKYSGEITAAMAARAGVSSEAAQQAFKAMGGAAGVTSVIGADQLQQIMSLPPEKRKDALIDAAGTLGAMFILGMLGAGKPGEGSEAETAKESKTDATAGNRPSQPENILQKEAQKGWTSPGLTAKDGVIYSETDSNKGGTPLGVNKHYVQVEVEGLKRRFPGAPETHVVQSPDELPEPYKTQVKDALNRGVVRKAFYDTSTGESWLIGDHLTPQEVRLTAYEEMIGHPGMEPLIKPEDYRQLFRDIQTYKPDKFAEIWKNYNISNITDPDAKIRKVVSEYVAKEAPRLDESDPLWGRVRDTLLGALQRVGLLPDRFGAAALDAQMRALARKAGDQLRATPAAGPRPPQSGPSPSQSDDLRLSQPKDSRIAVGNQFTPKPKISAPRNSATP